MFCRERFKEVMQYRGYKLEEYDEYVTKFETYSDDFNQFERKYILRESETVFPTNEEKCMILSKLQADLLTITKTRTPLYAALYKDIINILNVEEEWKKYMGEDINDSIFESYDTISSIDLPNKKWNDLLRIAERCINDIKVRSIVDTEILNKWFRNTLTLLIFFKSNIEKYLYILITKRPTTDSLYLCKAHSCTTIELHPIFINGICVNAVYENNKWTISDMTFDRLKAACEEFISSLACLEKLA